MPPVRPRALYALPAAEAVARGRPSAGGLREHVPNWGYEPARKLGVLPLKLFLFLYLLPSHLPFSKYVSRRPDPAFLPLSRALGLPKTISSPLN